MEKLRCVIAEMSHQMLADIIHSSVENSGIVEVVARLDGANKLADKIAQYHVDVLILGIAAADFNSVSDEILQQIPDLLIIGLVNDGRRLTMMMNDVGHLDIPNLIEVLRFPQDMKQDRGYH